MSQTIRKKTHLIVVPASTLANWEIELKRFCPSLVFATYHGNQIERADMRYDLRDDLEAGKVDVLLSTFTIFERDSGRDDRAFLCRQKFEYLIIDEAHCLKVSTSSRFINLNEIKAAHRLLLSGTPVQNDLRELLALMSFIMPDVFRKMGIDEVLEGFDWDESSSAPSHSSSAVSINQLRAMLAPFVLRRIKSDVLDQLVDKTSLLEKVHMTPFQDSVYDNIVSGYARRKERIKENILSAIAAEKLANGKIKIKKIKPADISLVVDTVDDATSEIIATTQSDSNNVINHELSASEAAHLFTALRKAANHPLLLRVRYQDEAVMGKIAEVCHIEGRFGRQCDYQRVRDEIDKFSDFDLHQLCLEFSTSLGHLQLDSEVLYDSQKMRKLKEMVPKLVVRSSYYYGILKDDGTPNTLYTNSNQIGTIVNTSTSITNNLTTSQVLYIMDTENANLVL